MFVDMIIVNVIDSSVFTRSCIFISTIVKDIFCSRFCHVVFVLLLILSFLANLVNRVMHITTAE